MAEFATVLKQLHRMCADNACNDCPVFYQGYCQVLGGGNDMMIESEIERVVMRWAAEHPEPQYPTWEEWQKTNFPDAESAIFPCSFDSKKNVGCNRVESCKGCRAHPIPAEIAKKLGIKPKGGHGNDAVCITGAPNEQRNAVWRGPCEENGGKKDG